MKINLQPTNLSHSLLYLTPLQNTDFDVLFLVASDKLLWEQHPNPNRYKKEDFINFFDGAMQSKGAFLIRDTVSNNAVGCSRFYDYNPADSSIFIGYTFIGRNYWGKGYNAILKKLMLAYAFQFVDNVIFHVGSKNIRSQQAMQKMGVKKTGEKVITYFKEAAKLNFEYTINKEEYLGNQ